VFESYEYVAGLIQEKNMSIGRLQKMLFGEKTEKTRQAQVLEAAFQLPSHHPSSGPGSRIA